MAGNLAITFVGDARLDAVGQVLLLGTDLRRNNDLQLAIGVECAALLGLLLTAVSIGVTRLVAARIVAFVASVRI